MKVEKLEKYIFYIAYFFFLLYAFFGMIDIFRNPLNLLTYFAMALVAFQFILQTKKFTLNELIKLVLLISLSIVYIYISGNFLILKLALIVIVTRNVKFDERIRYDLKLRIIFLIIMLFLCNVGIAEDVQFYSGTSLRHSLGFSNPNVLGMHVLILCLDILYLNKEKLTAKICILTSIIMLIGDYYSGSRTSMYIFIIAVLLCLLVKYKKFTYDNSFIKKILIYSPVWTSLLVYGLYILYIRGIPFGIIIDEILSGRLTNIEFFANNFPITLFGNEIASITKSLDTTNAYMIFAFGVTGLIIYIFGFVQIFKKLYQLKNYMLIVMVFIFVIYGVSEKLWLFADTNLFISIVGLIIFGNSGMYELNKKGDD